VTLDELPEEVTNLLELIVKVSKDLVSQMNKLWMYEKNIISLKEV
jgi:hypothetical protein